VAKSADQVRFITRVADARTEKEEGAPKGRRRGVAEPAPAYDTADLPKLVERLEAEMKEAAAALDFEAAARLRDELFELRAKMDGDRPRRGGRAEARAER
jgi:excinuclease ABC subunit B